VALFTQKIPKYKKEKEKLRKKKEKIFQTKVAQVRYWLILLICIME